MFITYQHFRNAKSMEWGSGRNEYNDFVCTTRGKEELTVAWLDFLSLFFFPDHVLWLWKHKQIMCTFGLVALLFSPIYSDLIEQWIFIYESATKMDEDDSERANEQIALQQNNSSLTLPVPHNSKGLSIYCSTFPQENSLKIHLKSRHSVGVILILSGRARKKDSKISFLANRRYTCASQQSMVIRPVCQNVWRNEIEK